MTTRNFALILGIAFTVIGIAGFIPGLVTQPAASGDVARHTGHGLLFGLFPVNWVHNLAHLTFGVWGLVASRALGAAKLYARVVAVAYGVLAVMGFIPGLQTVLGLMPVYGHDIWLHAIIAAAAAYFGFVHRDGTHVHAGSPSSLRP
jgi:hypothetical protein